ncbi:holo-ACP synthase [Cytobacillus praedii]|uniref:holo-ACP synthase n=1 Tax=Cytobacillus praedii TaxID=1742358 RepID=UPI003F7EC5C3
MIYGIGIDLQSIPQMSSLIKRRKDLFLNKVFTEDEIRYCNHRRNPDMHFAARWAVKEAVLKALGTGIAQGFNLVDIEILNHKSGEPYVNFYGKLNKHCSDLNIRVLVSISHSGDYAIGQAVFLNQ